MRHNFLLSLFLTFLIPFISIKAQDLSPEQIFDKSNGAVVVIHAYDYDGKLDAQGSGVVLKDKGIIITNFHIFAGNEKLEVKHNGKVIPYKNISGISVEKDLLILEIDTENFPQIPLGNVSDLKTGQKVYAIGSPMGLENSMSDGIVSGFRELDSTKKIKYIQFTASLSPGSSGGAVLNSKGELVGISTMGYKEGQNLNFAVGVNDIFDVDLGKYNDKNKIAALNYFFKGQNLFDEGSYKDAVKYYSKFIVIFPNEAKAYNFRGLAYNAQKDFNSAIKDYNQAIKLDPKFAPAFYNRADSYYKLEDNEKAIKDFSAVIKLDPNNVDAYYSRGILHAKEGNDDKAIEDYSKVIKSNPDYTAAYVNRGLVYYNKSDYERAIKDWKKAIKLKPELQQSLNPLIDNADLLWQHNIN